MNIHLDWELFQRIMMIGGMAWVVLWGAIKMGAKVLKAIAENLDARLVAIETSINKIESELSKSTLQYEALDARVRMLELGRAKRVSSDEV